MNSLYPKGDTIIGSSNNEDFYSRNLPSGAIKKYGFASILALTTSIGIFSANGGFLDEYSLFTPSNNKTIIEIPKTLDKDRVILVSSVSEQIAFIRNYFSLNISEASQILGVQRPSIYAWISETSSPSKTHQARINQLYDLAQIWKGKTNKPIGSLRKLPVESNNSITDLLSRNQIDKNSLVSYFDNLQDRLDTKLSRKTSSSIRQLAKDHGFEERSKSDKRRSFDFASGKKIT